MPACLPVCMSNSIYLSVFLSICLFVCHNPFTVSVCPSVCLSVKIHLFVCLSKPTYSVCLSVCPSVCLSVCLSIYLYACVSVCMSKSIYFSACLSVHMSAERNIRKLFVGTNRFAKATPILTNFDPANNTLFLLFDIYTKHDNNQNNFETTYLQSNLLLRYNKVKKLWNLKRQTWKCTSTTMCKIVFSQTFWKTICRRGPRGLCHMSQSSKLKLLVLSSWVNSPVFLAQYCFLKP